MKELLSVKEVRTFMNTTVLGIKVEYTDNTTEWLTEEEFNAIEQDRDREAQEQAGDK